MTSNLEVTQLLNSQKFLWTCLKKKKFLELTTSFWYQPIMRFSLVPVIYYLLLLTLIFLKWSSEKKKKGKNWGTGIFFYLKKFMIWFRHSGSCLQSYLLRRLKRTDYLSIHIWDQPGQQSKIPSQKKERKKKNFIIWHFSKHSFYFEHN